MGEIASVWDQIASFFERLPKIILPIGMLAVSGSAFIQMAERYGYLDGKEFGGVVSSAARIGLVAGLACLAVAALYAGIAAIKWVVGWVGNKARIEEEGARSIANVQFLEPLPMMALLSLLVRDIQRIEAKGNSLAITRLWNLSILQQENTYLISTYGPQGVLIIAPEIWRRRRQITRQFRPLVEQAYNMTPDSDAELVDWARRMVGPSLP